eukprot:1786817-Pleurochrysis_carterae.AAC.1
MPRRVRLHKCPCRHSPKHACRILRSGVSRGDVRATHREIERALIAKLPDDFEVPETLLEQVPERLDSSLALVSNPSHVDTPFANAYL